MEFLGFARRRRSARSAAARAAAEAARASPLMQPEPEADIPRWRRQSLIAARKGFIAGASADGPLRFDEEEGPDVDGLERRVIRYRLVSLLDIPDEARGVRIDALDEGDEVAVLEKRGTYLRVMCPDGREGWLHRMTLGVPAEPEEVTAAADALATDGPEGDGHPPDELAPTSFEDVVRAARLDRPQDQG